MSIRVGLSQNITHSYSPEFEELGSFFSYFNEGRAEKMEENE
ncbi:hypothetical protein [Atribacter laminatus]|nr:hypothetical protein [Atribacter laminatus]